MRNHITGRLSVTILACLLLDVPLHAQAVSERMRPAREADPALIAKVAARIRTSPTRVGNLARTQPNLYFTPEGEALYLCEVPAGAALGPQTPSDVPALLQPQANALPGTAAAPVGGDTSRFIQTTQYSAAQTFKLHSRPGAKRVIYLDFDGHVTSAASGWGGTITSPAYDTDGNPGSFSGAERGAVQAIWRQVSEDYAPFDIDVTTEEPGAGQLGYSGPADNLWGMRVVIGGSSTDWYKGGAGGVAFVGSFQRATEVPCFVFSKNLYGFNSVAYAASHEIGHTLGLSHDGTTAGDEYYGGHGNWAPIMGAGYGATVVQWSRGDYALANNTEDDLAVISQDAPYATSDVALSKATALLVAPGDVAGGTIARDIDQAWFRINMTEGAVDLSGEVAAFSPNLKLQMTLVDELDQVVAQTAVGGSMSARLRTNVTAGTYYLIVEGIGAGDPATSFNGYGSIGRFRVTGTWPDNQLPIASTAGSSPLSGKAPLTVAFKSDSSLDPGGTIVGWLWDFGDGTATSAEANPTHVYASPGTYVATLTVRDNLGGEASSSVTVTVGDKTIAARQMYIGSGSAQWVAYSRTLVQARAVVRILDSSGRPLPGVTVTASLSGLSTERFTVVTDRAGNATFLSRPLSTSLRGTTTLTVHGAVLPTFAYIPSANKLTTLTLRR
jgi:PKD repeat protein